MNNEQLLITHRSFYFLSLIFYLYLAQSAALFITARLFLLVGIRRLTPNASRHERQGEDCLRGQTYRKNN
jgi:hypothetical protein